MTSIDSNEVTNVEVRSEMDISTSEAIETNNDQDPNTSIIAKVDEETVLSSDVFAYDPAKYSFCKENSIVNILKVGDLGVIEFQSEVRDGVFCVTLWPESANSVYKQFIREINIAIPEATLWKNRRPNIGDFVYGKSYEEYWIRGYVVSLLPELTVAMIDEARLEMVSELATCEKPLCDIYAFSGICQLTHKKYEFEEHERFFFKVTGRTDNNEENEFEILIFDDYIELKANVKPWIPMPEQWDLPTGEVTNGCEVCVTGYDNHRRLYIRPLDTLGLARYNFIMETVAKCAETSPYLKGTPGILDWVLALAADGNYYRARMSRVETDRVEVRFYDLGRYDYVDRKTLKIFPEFLKKLGLAITVVKLQDVPANIPPLISIIKILDNLVENKVPLICTYDGIPSTDGIYLKYPNGESVNNMIRNCIFPKPRDAAEKIEK